MLTANCLSKHTQTLCNTSRATRYILHEATLWFTELAELIKKVSAQWNQSVLLLQAIKL